MRTAADRTIDPLLDRLVWMAGYGQWTWVYRHGAEPDRSAAAPMAGRKEDGAFCLPPAFGKRLIEADLLTRINGRFGYFFDFYKEEDLRSPVALAFVAGQLEEIFRDHELEFLVAELTSFLVACAYEGQWVTFWL